MPFNGDRSALLRIARSQKTLMVCLLVYVLSVIVIVMVSGAVTLASKPRTAQGSSDGTLAFVSLIPTIIAGAAVLPACRALGASPARAWTATIFAILLPFGVIVIPLLVNARLVRRLRGADLSVRFFRGPTSDAWIWLNASSVPEFCPSCQYSLKGLTGSICPECGQPWRST